jgi:RES domain-containing protein
VIFGQKTLELLEKIRDAPFEKTVFRHMFGDFSPERENTNGARWNPKDTPAVYTSLKREVAIAEADYYIAMQPLRPRAKRKIYKISVSLSSVLDLSDWQTLETFGLNKKTFDSVDHAPCQAIGGAVEWLGHDGLLVPSARAEGANLVIFPNKQKAGYKFSVLDFEELVYSP